MANNEFSQILQYSGDDFPNFMRGCEMFDNKDCFGKLLEIFVDLCIADWPAKLKFFNRTLFNYLLSANFVWPNDRNLIDSTINSTVNKILDLYVPNSNIPTHIAALNPQDFDFLFEAFHSKKIQEDSLQNYLGRIFEKFAGSGDWLLIEQLIAQKILADHPNASALVRIHKFTFQWIFKLVKEYWKNFTTNRRLPKFYTENSIPESEKSISQIFITKFCEDSKNKGLFSLAVNKKRNPFNLLGPMICRQKQFDFRDFLGNPCQPTKDLLLLLCFSPRQTDHILYLENLREDIMFGFARVQRGDFETYQEYMSVQDSCGLGSQENMQRLDYVGSQFEANFSMKSVLDRKAELENSFNRQKVTLDTIFSNKMFKKLINYSDLQEIFDFTIADPLNSIEENFQFHLSLENLLSNKRLIFLTGYAYDRPFWHSAFEAEMYKHYPKTFIKKTQNKLTLNNHQDLKLEDILKITTKTIDGILAKLNPLMVPDQEFKFTSIAEILTSFNEQDFAKISEFIVAPPPTATASRRP